MKHVSLDDLECGALLYGALSSLLVEDSTEAAQLLEHLVEKLKKGDPFSAEQLIEVSLSFVDDLSELGYVEVDRGSDYDDSDLELSTENIVEFDLKSYPSYVDPKKKLN